MTETNKKIKSKVQKESELQCVPNIYHLAHFGWFSVQAPMDLSSKINVMRVSFA